MMAKEEVAQVIAYCDENKIGYKQRLEELGINPWRMPEKFLQFVPG